nr:unnamed protein product [Callosobruchus chinensis]
MNELTTSFLNLFIALRIFLTLPITVASGKHSFSKLKLIENYLRFMSPRKIMRLGGYLNRKRNIRGIRLEPYN